MDVGDAVGEVERTTGVLSSGPGGKGGCDNAETPRQCWACRRSLSLVSW